MALTNVERVGGDQFCCCLFLVLLLFSSYYVSLSSFSFSISSSNATCTCSLSCHARAERGGARDLRTSKFESEGEPCVSFLKNISLAHL
jgi:hypothetical protein